MGDNFPKVTQIPSIAKYLHDIGITDPLQQRIEVIHSYIQKILPSHIVDIFIVEYIKEDGMHVYLDIDFYTDEGVISAHNFLTTIDIRTAPLKGQIVAIKIAAIDYNFERATNKSRLHVVFYVDFSEKVYGEFKATNRNCDYLMQIIKKYFLPNMKK